MDRTLELLALLLRSKAYIARKHMEKLKEDGLANEKTIGEWLGTSYGLEEAATLVESLFNKEKGPF